MGGNGIGMLGNATSDTALNITVHALKSRAVENAIRLFSSVGQGTMGGEETGVGEEEDETANAGGPATSFHLDRRTFRSNNGIGGNGDGNSDGNGG
jgi:hypothetical protein